MRVKQLLTDVTLVIADLEVHLNGELRSSPTLCALIPAGMGHKKKSFHSIPPMAVPFS